MAEEEPIDTGGAARHFHTATVITDKIARKASFQGVPKVDANKCPWCGGLDSIVDNRCQMPGCGKPVIYTGPKPVDEPAISSDEADMIARRRAEKMESLAGMGPLPGNIREMRREMRRRLDAAAATEQKPAPRPRRAPPVAMPDEGSGPADTTGEF
jgi:hypothetical protein